MTRHAEVVALLPDDAEGLVLESAAVVAWYLDGARTTVPIGGASVLVVLVARDGHEIRCPVMELERLRREEGVTEAVAVPWTEPLVPETWARDRAILREHDLDAELRAARASLTPAEVERYRTLGRDAAVAMTRVASGLRPDDTERVAAGRLAEAVYAIGAEPVVLLVAGERRLPHRHPLPTTAPLGQRAMLVLGARRHGLIVNLTRWVGRPDPAEQQLLAVEAAVLDATHAGTPLADVLVTLQRAYPANGFDGDEWRNHHQGGPTGYLGRDPKVTPDTPGLVAEHQAFAWNPSAPGLKAEDTVLTTRGGVEILTHDPAWPTIAIAGRPRPQTMPYRSEQP